MTGLLISGSSPLKNKQAYRIYIHMNTCVYISTKAHTYRYTHTHIHTHTNIHTHTYTHTTGQHLVSHCPAGAEQARGPYVPAPDPGYSRLRSRRAIGFLGTRSGRAQKALKPQFTKPSEADLHTWRFFRRSGSLLFEPLRDFVSTRFREAKTAVDLKLKSKT